MQNWERGGPRCSRERIILNCPAVGRIIHVIELACPQFEVKRQRRTILPTTENRDNGSLEMGATDVQKGDLVLLETTDGVNVLRVTRFCISKKGARFAYFKGQGPLPFGSVTWIHVPIEKLVSFRQAIE